MATLEVAIRANKAQQGASDFINATVQIKGASASALREVGLLNSGLDKTGSTAASVSRVIAGLFAGFSALQGVREVTRTYAEFEQTMASIRGVLELDAAQMQVVKDAAIEMGATSRSSANDAAEGILILAKAGFDAKQSIEALPGVLSLAITHQLKLGDAADYTANILHQFNLETNNTVRVVDILSTTANKSQADVRDLAEAMKYAGPSAGALKISVEEAAAAAGVLSDRGIKASLAGTNLRGMMVDLVNPTEKARKTLELLGLTVRDVDVRAVGFTGAMENLAKSGAGVQDLAKIFGVMQVSGASAIVQNIARLKELTKANYDAAGSTEKLVDIMNDTVMGRFKELLNVIGAAAIEIGDSGLGKQIKAFLVTVTDGIRVLLDMSDKIKGNKEDAEAAARVFRVLGDVLLAITVLKVATVFAGMSNSMIEALASGKNLTSVLALTLSLLTAMTAFNFGSHLHDNFKIVQQAGIEVVTTLTKGWEYIKYGWRVMTAFMAANWDMVMNAIKLGLANTLQFVGEFMAGMGDAFKDVPGLSDVSVGLKETGDAISKWAKDTKKEINAVPEDVTTSFNKLKAVIESVPNIFRFADRGTVAALSSLLLNIDSAMSKDITVDGLVKLDKDIKKSLDEIDNKGSAQAKVVASRIREAWDHGLQANLDATKIVPVDKLNETKRVLEAFMPQLSKVLDDPKLQQSAQRVHDILSGALGQKIPTDTLVKLNTDVQALLTKIESDRSIQAQVVGRRIRESWEKGLGALGSLPYSVRKSLVQSDLNVGLANADAVRAARYNEIEKEFPNGSTSKGKDFNPIEGLSAQLQPLKDLIAQWMSLGEVTKKVNAESVPAIEATSESVDKYTERVRDLSIFDEEELSKLAHSIGDEFGSAFKDMVLGAKSAREAIEGLTKSIIELVFQQLVAKQLSNWISGGIMSAFGAPAGGANAKGNAFNMGTVVPFASGTVVSSPTFFPMSGGRTGLMGESGPEAIMPLTRAANGKLAVQAVGNSGGTRVVNNSFVIQANNPNEFRGSERQIAGKVKSSLQRMN